jgi:AcrR family transcriptional regulator
MPKLVDHEKQRKKVAEAAWRVIQREGMEQATVRKIAEEAAVSAGSLRHYFSTQSELLAFSMELVSDRVKERISKTAYDGPPLEAMKAVLLELLPGDDERKLEMEVWFAFTARSLSDADLHELGMSVFHEMRGVMLHITQGLKDLELARPGLDAEVEADRLLVFIDGLALHMILHPTLYSREYCEGMVARHLKSLCRP